MKISIEKQSNNQNTYRTPLEQIDSMQKEPTVGECLVLESSTFESGGIMTSKVLDVKSTDDGFEVKTLNSTYLIKVLKEQ
jgi:hypothetical protein